MKMKQLFATCGVAAALILGAGTVLAQNNGGGGGGGFGGGGGGGGGFRNMDPAQMQQMMMDRIRNNLNFTNDTDWNAVQPLVQKVLDARRDLGNGGARMFFGGRNRNRNGGDQGGGGGGGGGRGGFFGQASPEQQALQNALDNNAPDAQVKDLLAKYEASQQKKQAALKAAQENLRAVLTPRQEAEAALMSLVE